MPGDCAQTGKNNPGRWRALAFVMPAPEGPFPNRPNIHVHKLAAGVVPHPSGVEAQSSVAQSQSAYARNTDIDGLGQHMLRVLCDAGEAGSNTAATRAKVLIRPRGAVTTDDVDGGVRTLETREQGMQGIELPGIIRMNVLGTVVAKEVIEFIDRFGKIPIADTVDDVEILSGVEVMEMKLVTRSLGRGLGGGGCRNGGFGRGGINTAGGKPGKRTTEKKCRAKPGG